MQSADMGVGEESVNPTQSVLHPIATVLDLTDIPASGVRDYFLYHPYDGHLEAAYVSVPAAGTFADFSIQIIQKQGNRVIAESTEERIGSITTDARQLNLPASFGEGGVFARVRYNPVGGAGADFDDGTYVRPLDVYTGALIAYGVRLLRSDHTGGCMTVRETGGGGTTDIGFDSLGHLDQDAIAAHCGSNDGYVSAWFDQTGGGHDMIQTNTTLQPKIYDGATRSVLSVNGKPSIQFQGTGFLYNLTHTTATTSAPTPGYVFATLGSSGAGTGNFMVGSTSQGVVNFGYSVNGGTGPTETNVNIGGYWVNDSVVPGGVNGLLYAAIQQQGVVSVEWTSTYSTPWRFRINYNNPFVGALQVQDYIVYYADKSADRRDIEANLNTYYGVYGGEDGVTLNPSEPEPTKMFLTLHVRTGEIT